MEANLAVFISCELNLLLGIDFICAFESAHEFKIAKGCYTKVKVSIYGCLEALCLVYCIIEDSESPSSK